jgi:hypothetical protein
MEPTTDKAYLKTTRLYEAEYKTKTVEGDETEDAITLSITHKLVIKKTKGKDS